MCLEIHLGDDLKCSLRLGEACETDDNNPILGLLLAHPLTMLWQDLEGWEISLKKKHSTLRLFPFVFVATSLH